MRVCWNRQTGTFEGRVSLTYGFKSHYSHQNKSADSVSTLSADFLFIFSYDRKIKNLLLIRETGFGGEGGIRTLDELLTHTRVPVVRHKPG